MADLGFISKLKLPSNDLVKLKNYANLKSFNGETLYDGSADAVLAAASVGLANVKNIDQSNAIKSITRNGTTFTYTTLDGATGTFTQQDTTYDIATQAESGLLSAADKTKLDGMTSSALLDLVYPVGSIYMNANNISPASFLGGTWEEITGKFLLARSSAHEAGTTGGNETITLSPEQLPSHTHTFTGTAVTSGIQSANHTHATTVNFSFGTGRGLMSASANLARLDGGTNSTASLSSGETRYFAAGSGHYQSTTSYTAGNDIITVNKGYTSGINSVNHTHTVTAAGTNSNTGGGEAINIMPNYLAVYMWERTA